MINIIGVISKTVATDDPEVFETNELDGYCVNSTVEIEGADDYLIEAPSEPYNLFFGVSVENTYFYKFADEAECKLILEIEEELPDE